MTIPRSTPLDRARALARRYRADLTKHAPNTAHQLDLAATAAGEQWITDTTTGPDVCTTTEAAHLLGVTDRRIRQLIATGDLPTAAHDRRGYLLYVAAVINHQTARNRLVADGDATGVPSLVGNLALPGNRQTERRPPCPAPPKPLTTTSLTPSPTAPTPATKSSNSS